MGQHLQEQPMTSNSCEFLACIFLLLTSYLNETFFYNNFNRLSTEVIKLSSLVDQDIK